MDLQNIFHKKIKRQNFFFSLGMATAGLVVMRSTIFKILSKKYNKPADISSNIKIKINSSAVKRTNSTVSGTKIGGNNA